MKGDDRREPLFDAAESKTPSMCGNSLHGNRETPATSSTGTTRSVVAGKERSDKAHRRTADVHVAGESDGPIVPKKRANKGGTPAAEPVEERGPTKGNAIQRATRRTQCRIGGSFSLHRVRQVGRQTTDRHT